MQAAYTLIQSCQIDRRSIDRDGAAEDRQFSGYERGHRALREPL
jgi:hypothetical protein